MAQYSSTTQLSGLEATRRLSSESNSAAAPVKRMEFAGVMYPVSLSLSPSDASSIPNSGSIPESPLTPVPLTSVSQRRSHPLCTDSEVEDDHLRLFDESSMPVSSCLTPSTISLPTYSPTLLPSYSDNSNVASVELESGLVPSLRDSCSGLSLLYGDIESAFPQPPSSSGPLIRRMRSTPSLQLTNSMKELVGLLGDGQHASSSAYTLPPVRPLVIVKARLTSASTSVLPRGDSVSSQAHGHSVELLAEHGRWNSSTVQPVGWTASTERPCTNATPMAFPPASEQDCSTAQGNHPEQRPAHRYAMSFSTSSDSMSFFQRAKLGTKKSFAHFLRPPAASQIDPYPIQMVSSSVERPLPPLPSGEPHIVRKVSSLRGPGKEDVLANGFIHLDESSKRIAALGRLNLSMAELRTHGKEFGRTCETPEAHSLPNSVEFGCRSPSPNAAPRQRKATHRLAHSDSSSRFSPSPDVRQFFVARDSEPVAFPEVESAGDNLKSFVDIDPAPKDKIKRLLANAGQLAGWRRTSTKK